MTILSAKGWNWLAGRQAPCDNLYVRNMPATWTEQVPTLLDLWISIQMLS